MNIWKKILGGFHTITIGNYKITFYDLWDDKFCWEVYNSKVKNSVPVAKRNHVLAFVALKHADQKRKYTGEPYLSHLQSVAKMADGRCRLGYEIGLCHDLLEDTDCTQVELYKALVRFGYEILDAGWIVARVIDLTDVYTNEKYSGHNRKERKKFEAQRLFAINPDAQTVKYCDLIDNAKSIVEHDPGFAMVFINEAMYILSGMLAGNPDLYKQCSDEIYDANKKLIKLK